MTQTSLHLWNPNRHYRPPVQCAANMAAVQYLFLMAVHFFFDVSSCAEGGGGGEGSDAQRTLIRPEVERPGQEARVQCL